MQKNHSKLNIVDRLIITYSLFAVLLGIPGMSNHYSYVKYVNEIRSAASLLISAIVGFYYFYLKWQFKPTTRGIWSAINPIIPYLLLMGLNIYSGWTTCLRIAFNWRFQIHTLMSLLSIVLIGINILCFVYYVTELRSSVQKREFGLKSSVIIIVILMQIVIFFALIYANICDIDRTSFKGIKPEYNEHPFQLFVDFLYFSTVTFTTLGYGDITPASSAAKMVVMFEVLLFVIYISIILLNLANNRHREIPSKVSPNVNTSSDSNSHEGESSENDK